MNSGGLSGNTSIISTLKYLLNYRKHKPDLFLTKVTYSTCLAINELARKTAKQNYQKKINWEILQIPERTTLQGRRPPAHAQE